MKYVVAVSGGVDSVVLLSMLVQSGEHELIVAHFDHGIRQDSCSDERFVRQLAANYGLRYESKRVKLGATASEEVARTERYNFLRSIAKNEQAQIVTAHHMDDVVESIAINIYRGTGWRGLAVLGDATIVRPLVRYEKSELYDYAMKHSLEWVEDETNRSDTYLRNRIRKRTSVLNEQSKNMLMRLWREQIALAARIDEESNRLLTNSRYFVTMVDSSSAIELLRAVLAKHALSLTIPQRQRMLHAIKTARPGTTLEAGHQTVIVFTMREFIVKHP